MCLNSRTNKALIFLSVFILFCNSYNMYLSWEKLTNVLSILASKIFSKFFIDNCFKNTR